jgi:DNA-binding CsgD family transcriptional regulator
MKNLELIMQKIDKIDSKNDLEAFFLEIEHLFNYSWAGLVVFEPYTSQRYKTVFIGDIPKNVSAFIERDDAIKQYCLTEGKPTYYQNVLAASDVFEQKSIFQQDQYQLIVPIKGLASELSCLIFSIPKLSVSHSLLEKLGWYWLLLSSFIYTKYKNLITKNKSDITTRELECIQWAADGKTSWEISQILSISQRTVDFHLANCISKSNSANRQQAIVKYVLNGQL